MKTKEKIEDSVSIRDYFNIQIKELKNYMDVKFDSIEKSTCLAQQNLNTRLESMNEFRMSLKDQATNFVTRNEHIIMMTKYDNDLALLSQANARNEGKASQKSVTIAYLLAGLGLILSGIGLVVHSMLT